MHQILTLRAFWLALFVSASGLEAAGLYFQYALELDPCVLCIYERVAVAGLALAGLLGLVAPRLWLWRVLCYALWTASAIWGITLAMEHVGIQFGTPDLSCEFFANFPTWFRLDEWLPSIFMPTGYCEDIQWQLLGVTLPQMMLVVYAGYLMLLLIALVGEFRKLAARPTTDG